MRMRKQAGFTLVEILIVVVILGILAAIVIPQFTSASQEAIKGALSSQLSTIESQFELYRVRNQGAMPFIAGGSLPGPAGADPNFPDPRNGWGVLVSAQYLKEEPINQYVPGNARTTLVDAANNIAAGDPAANTPGWGFREQDLAVNPVLTAKIFAQGFDLDNNLLSNEQPDPANPAVVYTNVISP